MLRTLKLCRSLRVVEQTNGRNEVTGAVIVDRFGNELLRLDEDTEGRVTHESGVAMMEEVVWAVNNARKLYAALRKIKRIRRPEDEEYEIAKKALGHAR